MMFPAVVSSRYDCSKRKIWSSSWAFFSVLVYAFLLCQWFNGQWVEGEIPCFYPLDAFFVTYRATRVVAFRSMGDRDSSRCLSLSLILTPSWTRTGWCYSRHLRGWCCSLPRTMYSLLLLSPLLALVLLLLCCCCCRCRCRCCCCYRWCRCSTWMSAVARALTLCFSSTIVLVLKTTYACLFVAQSHACFCGAKHGGS